MKLRHILLVIGFSLLLSSCERGCQRLKRNTQTSKRSYVIEIYSGGKLIFTEHFHGIVTEEEGNGCYYYKGDTLVEVSGDYILKSVK